MIVDTSALVAIIRGEAEERAFANLIADAPNPRISAATYLETAIVIDGFRDPNLSRELDTLIADIVIAPVTPTQAKIAREAYRDFGRGSGHKAQLNFGDCFAYALAKEAGEPLLYKGADFAHTDLRSAAGK